MLNRIRDFCLPKVFGIPLGIFVGREFLAGFWMHGVFGRFLPDPTE